MIQFTKGGICRVVPAAAAVLLPLLEQLSGDGLITAQGHVLDMVSAFVSPFGLGAGNGQVVTAHFVEKAIPFWEEVRQHSTLQQLAQLTAACRGTSADRWRGASLMGEAMKGMLRSQPWAGDGEVDSRIATLVFHHAAARDPALQSFVSETSALLCADLMAGQCDGYLQEAAQSLDHPSLYVYCLWIHLTRKRSDWSPASLRTLYSPQGLVSCLVPFAFGAPGAYYYFTATVFSALIWADMVHSDLSDEPPNSNCLSVGGEDRAATEQLVLGMVRQAAALLQLRRMPAVKCLAAAQKAATACFLQVCTG